jgi:hypothetical protein
MIYENSDALLLWDGLGGNTRLEVTCQWVTFYNTIYYICTFLNVFGGCSYVVLNGQRPNREELMPAVK